MTTPPEQPREHIVKTLPEFFEAGIQGRKPFEIRLDDRDYREGDTLTEREWDGEKFTGREHRRVITYVTNWQQPGRYVVLGLKRLPEQPNAAPQGNKAGLDQSSFKVPSSGNLPNTSGLAGAAPDPQEVVSDVGVGNLGQTGHFKPEQRVVCAANRNADTGTIICGARHFDQIMHNQMALRPESERDGWRESEQGFIDQFGEFLTREQAWVIAEKNGQIIREVGSGKGVLYSENLY